MKHVTLLIIGTLLITSSFAQAIRYKKIKSVNLIFDPKDVNSGSEFHYTIMASTKKGKYAPITGASYTNVTVEGGKVIRPGVIKIDPSTDCSNNSIVLQYEISKGNDIAFSGREKIDFTYTGTITLDYSGENGKDGKREKSKNPVLGNKSVFGKDGGDGRNGARGENGDSGKNITVYIIKDSLQKAYFTKVKVDDTIYCYKSLDTPKFIIKSNGGDGGNGGNGTDGRNGKNGRINDKGKHIRAGNGGNGGDGGDGGNGGNGGVITVYLNKATEHLIPNIEFSTKGGRGARGGKAGKGGKAGTPLAEDSYTPHDGNHGRNGRDGEDGTNGTHKIVITEEAPF